MAQTVQKPRLGPKSNWCYQCHVIFFSEFSVFFLFFSLFFLLSQKTIIFRVVVRFGASTARWVTFSRENKKMYRIIGQRAKNGIFSGIRNFSNMKDTGTRLTLDQVHQALMEQGEISADFFFNFSKNFFFCNLAYIYLQ